MSEILSAVGAQPQAYQQVDGLGQQPPAGTQDVASLGGVVADLLAGKSVKVNVSATQDAEAKTVQALVEIEVADESAIGRVDLVHMTMLLKMQTDERQAKTIQDQIEADKSSISTRSKERMAKVDKTLKEMDKAAKASIFKKIFGWIGAIVAVAMAAVLSIASGGVAVGAVIGAVLAVSMQVMEETGATDKLMKALAKSIQDTFGCDKQTAQIWATAIFAVSMCALSIGSLGGAGKTAMNIANNMSTLAAKAFKLTQIATQVTMQVGGLAASAATSVTGYQSQMAQADLTETNAVLKHYQQALEENQDRLEEIIKLLLSGGEAVAEALESTNDSNDFIAEQMGRMA